MRVWEEYCRVPETSCRWRNEADDEVWVRPADPGYEVAYKPARSDIVTRVPNGAKPSFDDAVCYARRVVMQGHPVERFQAADDRVFDRLARTGEYPAL